MADRWKSSIGWLVGWSGERIDGSARLNGWLYGCSVDWMVRRNRSVGWLVAWIRRLLKFKGRSCLTDRTRGGLLKLYFSTDERVTMYARQGWSMDGRTEVSIGWLDGW